MDRQGMERPVAVRVICSMVRTDTSAIFQGALMVLHVMRCRHRPHRLSVGSFSPDLSSLLCFSCGESDSRLRLGPSYRVPVMPHRNLTDIMLMPMPTWCPFHTSLG